MKRALSTLFVLVLATGCYHATIDTGRTPSPQVVENKWAHSFIFGLVPPNVVSTAQQCPNGVAKVETQHSFLNGLVAFLTWSLYTPIEIKATCAAAGGRDDANLPVVKAGADKAAAMQDAVKLSIQKDTPVLVKF
jgi:hypothetical protein